MEGVPELSWVANNGAKLQQPGLTQTGGAWTIGTDSTLIEDAWVADSVLHKLVVAPHTSAYIGNRLTSFHLLMSRTCVCAVSSPVFGEKNKVPQENVPDAKREEITNRLLVAFERAVGVKNGGKPGMPIVKPSLTFVQLWGAGNPISVADLPPETPYLYQGKGVVVVNLCLGGAE